MNATVISTRVNNMGANVGIRTFSFPRRDTLHSRITGQVLNRPIQGMRQIIIFVAFSNFNQIARTQKRFSSSNNERYCYFYSSEQYGCQRRHSHVLIPSTWHPSLSYNRAGLKSSDSGYATNNNFCRFSKFQANNLFPVRYYEHWKESLHQPLHFSSHHWIDGYARDSTLPFYS